MATLRAALPPASVGGWVPRPGAACVAMVLTVLWPLRKKLGAKMKRWLSYILALAIGVAAAFASFPLTWQLCMYALYVFGHRMGLGYNVAMVLYFACWGLAGIGVCALLQWIKALRSAKS